MQQTAPGALGLSAQAESKPMMVVLTADMFYFGTRELFDSEPMTCRVALRQVFGWPLKPPSPPTEPGLKGPCRSKHGPRGGKAYVLRHRS